MSDHAPTHCDRLLARLQRSSGDWVAMPELARAMSEGGDGTGLCVSRRIYDLRKRGHLIEVRDEHHDGRRHTWYRLMIAALELQPISPAAPVVDTTAGPTEGSQTDLPLTERAGEPPQEITP